MSERELPESIFIKFQPPEARETFLESIKNQSLSLSERIYRSRTQPVVIVSDVLPNEMAMLRDLVGDSGEFYSDFQLDFSSITASVSFIFPPHEYTIQNMQSTKPGSPEI